MIRSMSGYGRGEAVLDGLRVVAEARTVNHRFCRISIRLPAEIAFFEEPGRRLVQKRVRRGKVDCHFKLERAVEGKVVQVDRELAAEYVRELRALAQESSLAGDLDLQTIAGFPGVVSERGGPEIDPEAAAPQIRRALDLALDELDAMRVREGEHLAEDLGGRVDILERGLDTVEELAGEIPTRVRDQLQARIAELLEGTGTPSDPDRITQEVVFHADRADVTEEIVRLRSHLARTRELVGQDDSVGRALEFIVQELHRELSTIGSKTRELQLTDLMLDMKAEVERIREQVQNVE